MHLAKLKQTSFTRSLMAGFACGIVAALLNVVYAYVYRNATGFDGFVLFTPLLIFIGFPILFVITGVILYEMIDRIKNGRLWFTVFFLLLMALAIVFDVNRQSKGSEGMLLGIILITGLLMAFLLPYLATHAKIFMDEEEFKETEDI
jgi:hypothetical protein